MTSPSSRASARVVSPEKRAWVYPFARFPAGPGTTRPGRCVADSSRPMIECPQRQAAGPDLAEQFGAPVQIAGVGHIAFGVAAAIPREHAVGADVDHPAPRRAGQHRRAVREQRVDREARQRIGAAAFSCFTMPTQFTDDGGAGATRMRERRCRILGADVERSPGRR